MGHLRTNYKMMEEFINRMKHFSRVPIINSKKHFIFFVVAILVSLPAVRVLSGPKEWSGNGHSYEVVATAERINWFEASARAIESGGYLATIVSREENDFVFSLVNNSAYWFKTGPDHIGPWIGGYQPSGSREPNGNWQWVTGEPFSFQSWLKRTNEPNNAGGNEDGIFFYNAYSDKRVADWNDFNRAGALPKAYVIEYDRFPLIAENLPPVIEPISNLTTPEDRPSRAINILVSDDSTPFERIAVNVTSSNEEVIPNANLSVGDNGVEYSLIANPLSNQNGVTEITVTAIDEEGLVVKQIFELSVLPVNDSPTLDDIPDQEVGLGKSILIGLTGISSGAENESDFLDFAVSVDGSGVISDPRMSYVQGETVGSITLGGLGVGQVLVDVSVDDGGSENSRIVRSFSVSVPPPVERNTFPQIEPIADQIVRVGQTPPAIEISVRDKETALANLVVEAESLDERWLQTSNVTVSRNVQGAHQLEISSLGVPPGGNGIGIRVTVTDGAGATASTEFNVTVLNDFPVVEIIEPIDEAIIEIPDGVEAVDLPFTVGVIDDQSVDEMGLEVNGGEFEGDIGVVEGMVGRFSGALPSLAIGEYSLRAWAKDRATGEVAYSEITPFKVVAGGKGEIAIVHPLVSGREEVFTVWDYLVDLGHQPKVFLQEEISVEALADYRAVIWHDLGSTVLRDHTVEVLAALQDRQGIGGLMPMPIYFIGTQLRSAAANVTNEARRRWIEMAKIGESLGRVLLNPVVFGEEGDPNRGAVGDYWALAESFLLDGDTDAYLVQPGVEVLAVAGNEESVLVHRYPPVDKDEIPVPRRFVQGFPLRARGGDDASFARRALFENALCFLLAKDVISECECESAVISPVISQLGSDLSFDVGEEFSIDTALINNGRCSARGGQISVTLPPGLLMVDIESSKGVPVRWEENPVENTRTAFLAVGIVEEQSREKEDVSLSFKLVATQSGSHRVEIQSTGNNFDGQTEILEITAEREALEGEVSLGIERSPEGLVNLVVVGSPFSVVKLEWSASLGALAGWRQLRTVTFSANQRRKTIEIRPVEGERFYRIGR